MDQLPSSLLLEVLSRVTDSTDLARCRLASKALNALSYEVRSINLLCTMSRYLSSRSAETQNLLTPFKTVFLHLLRRSSGLDSVSIGVDKSLGEVPFDDVEDEADDLYLTDMMFLRQWLPQVGGNLKSLSISDFWVQSCWRRSDALSLIASCCTELVVLEMKNAWLSVDGLCPMPTLTSLTLEFVRLDDESLDKINTCFPNLRHLNLIGVGGLLEPKICLSHLTACRWSVSNAPLSLTISCPNLVILKLRCIKPQLIVLEAPSLSQFHLYLEKTEELRLKASSNLKCLQLEFSNHCSLSSMFPCGNTINKLSIDLVGVVENSGVANFSLATVFECFSNLSCLNLGGVAWFEVESHFHRYGLEDRSGMKTLTELVVHLSVHETDCTHSFLFAILNKCTKLSDISLLVHRKLDVSLAATLTSEYAVDFPRVRWRWGVWEEGTKDIWVSEGI